jgi:hypothetical protein
MFGCHGSNIQTAALNIQGRDPNIRSSASITRSSAAKNRCDVAMRRSAASPAQRRALKSHGATTFCRPRFPRFCVDADADDGAPPTIGTSAPQRFARSAFGFNTPDTLYTGYHFAAEWRDRSYFAELDELQIDNFPQRQARPVSARLGVSEDRGGRDPIAVVIAGPAVRGSSPSRRGSWPC